MTSVILYNTVYTFDLSEEIKFGSLPTKELQEVFTDGRASSHLLERQIPYWFSSLVRQNNCKKEYDFEDNSNKKYEMKTFTKRGCKFCPSNMVGKGRKFDYNRMKVIASYTDYILCDITEFPIIKIVFKNGNVLLSQYSNTEIKYGEKQNIFG
jgi:hypothetical protein